MSGSPGFEVVEHRVKQITRSFAESRNLLAEIEDNLHSLNQLRRGESDRIAEVDTELLTCSSSIQGGLDRVTRLRGNGVVPTDDPILFVLDKAFESVEEKLYRVLIDAHSNNGFIDYGSLINASQQVSTPLVAALKDLARRLRSPSDAGGPSELTPPGSGSDRPVSRSTSHVSGPRTTIDSSISAGSNRYDQQMLPIAGYNMQGRKGSSLASSTYSSSLYDRDSYQSELESPELLRYREHDGYSTKSNSMISSTGLPLHSDKDKVIVLPSVKSRIHSTASQPHTISSIQEEFSDPEVVSIKSSTHPRYATRPFDSRTNSTSDDGSQYAHAYGSSWKNSVITTPESLPSPISPGTYMYSQGDSTYGMAISDPRDFQPPARSQLRESRIDRTNKHESTDAVSPHSQARIQQTIDSFGPPPAPPPIRRLPEPPRPVKVSLFPAPMRRDRNKDLGSPSSQDSPRSEEGGPVKQISPPSASLPFRQPVLPASPPDSAAFVLPQKPGSHGLNFTPPLSPAPTPRTAVLPNTSAPVRQRRRRSMDYPEPALPHLSPVMQISPAKAVDAQWVTSEEVLPYPPPVRKPAPLSAPPPTAPPMVPSNVPPVAPPVALSAIQVEAAKPRQGSKSSLAQTTSSDGTVTQDRWLCLTRSVKQVPGVVAGPVNYVPSTSGSTRPADNLPTEANKFWTLCKNAVTMQTGEGKKSADEVANRPAGITGTEKYMKCRKCKYEYSAYSKGGKGAMTDPRWKDGPGGLLYRETILFKSHLNTKKEKLPQEDQHFGCIFCASTGNGMPVFKGKASFLHHLLEHSDGNYPSEVCKTRIKFVKKSEYKINPQEEYFELALP